MYRPLILLLVVTAVNSQANQGGDLENVLVNLFGTPPPSTSSPPAGGGGPVTGGGQETGGGQGTTFVPSSTIVPAPTPVEEDGKPCKTDSGESGQCFPYYQCENNTVIQDGQGLIDIRLSDGPCDSYMDTCCLLGDVRPPDDPITPTPPPVPTPTGCGYRNPEGVGFKTTGDVMMEAKFGEFPWMVAILKIEPVNDNDPEGQRLNVYVGGGSLIHPSVVLTAAHYVAESKALRVRAGEWDTQTKKEIYPYQDRDVSSIEVHKDFNKGNLFYDVAVLFLAAPMELAPNVGVACLPPQGAVAAAGTRCFASGWGKDQFGKAGRYQIIMKKVELPVVDRMKCQRQLRETRLGRHFQLHHTFMCAGGAKEDTCKGDGGSPLVCPIEFEENRYVQNGIVAWGIGCGEKGTPGVYVDVGKVRNWIDNKVTAKGYELTYNVVGLTA